jgi:NADH-quinone oxidoreductase subunit L
LIACLAIAGIPPFSGFFSKDEILSACYEFSPSMGIVMTIIAGLTAFYMFRLYYNIFWGKEYQLHNEEGHHAHTPHESPASMSIPLIFLAAVTCIAGLIPFGHFVTSDATSYNIHLNLTVATISVIVAVIGIAIATVMYRKESPIPAKLAKSFDGFYTAATHRFYIDEVYLFITKKIIFNNIARPIAWFDRHVIDGTMNGIASSTQWIAVKIKGFQSGQIQQYAYVFLLGTLLIAVLLTLLVI